LGRDAYGEYIEKCRDSIISKFKDQDTLIIYKGNSEYEFNVPIYPKRRTDIININLIDRDDTFLKTGFNQEFEPDMDSNAFVIVSNERERNVYHKGYTVGYTLIKREEENED